MNPEDAKCQNHSADAYYIHSAFRQSVYRVLHSVNLTRQPSSGASGALLAPQQFFGGRRKEGEGASPRLHPGFGTTTTWNSANNNPLGNRLQYVQYSLQLGISIMTQEIAELVKDLYTSHFTLPVPTQIPLILHDPYPPNNTRKEGVWITELHAGSMHSHARWYKLNWPDRWPEWLSSCIGVFSVGRWTIQPRTDYIFVILTCPTWLRALFRGHILNLISTTIPYSIIPILSLSDDNLCFTVYNYFN